MRDDPRLNIDPERVSVDGGIFGLYRGQGLLGLLKWDIATSVFV
jgi:hypothetical protein